MIQTTTIQTIIIFIIVLSGVNILDKLIMVGTFKKIPDTKTCKITGIIINILIAIAITYSLIIK